MKKFIEEISNIYFNLLRLLLIASNAAKGTFLYGLFTVVEFSISLNFAFIFCTFLYLHKKNKKKQNKLLGSDFLIIFFGGLSLSLTSRLPTQAQEP